MSKSVPYGVTFHSDNILHLGDTGDNFNNTWGPDDKVYFSYCDGNLFPDIDGFPDENLNHALFTVSDGPGNYRIEFLPGFPFYPLKKRHYGYGIIFIDGCLYHFISVDYHENFLYFHGSKLVYSEDFGNTWFYHNGKPIDNDRFDLSGKNAFFWEEGSSWSFSHCCFVQCGKNNSLAKDDYVYIYSPYGRNPGDPDNPWNQMTHRLCLARVHKKDILKKSSYTYFSGYNPDGSAGWTNDISQLRFVCQFPAKYHGYSWFPTVVYNPHLDLYIMAASATGCDGNKPWEGPFARLILHYSKAPYGPWLEFHDDEWCFNDDGCHYYQPKLSCKFFENKGKDMYLLYSATGKDEWRGLFYKFNQIKMTLKMK